MLWGAAGGWWFCLPGEDMGRGLLVPGCCVVAGWVWWFDLWIVCASILFLWWSSECGIRWMPWHQAPMKDVGGRDSPRGVVNRAVIRGCPNGET